MISLVFKHPFEILGFCAKVIEEALGSHKLSMHLSLFIFWFNDKSSFKYPSETLGFRVRMIKWTLEAYKLFILSFLSFFINPMRNLVSLRDSKSLTLDKGIKEKKVLGLQPHFVPILLAYLFVCYVSCFHSFICCVPCFSVVCYSLWYILRA